MAGSSPRKVLIGINKNPRGLPPEQRRIRSNRLLVSSSTMIGNSVLLFRLADYHEVICHTESSMCAPKTSIVFLSGTVGDGPARAASPARFVPRPPAAAPVRPASLPRRLIDNSLGRYPFCSAPVPSHQSYRRCSLILPYTLYVSTSILSISANCIISLV